MSERGFTMTQLLNKGKLVKLSLTVVLVCSFGQAALSEDLPDEEQVAKFVAAVWKDKPNSIDATVYKTITRPAKSRQQIRERVQDVFAKEKSWILQKYDPNSHGRRVMLERLNRTIDMNVERIMKEQQTPTRIKERIRISDGRERQDVAYARTPAVPLGPNTPFESTVVDLGEHVQGDIKAFSYYHDRKTANIDTNGWKASHIEDLTGLPPFITIGCKVAMGTKASSGLYIPDPDKIQEVQRTGVVLDTFTLTVVPDPNAPATRDRIELRARDYPVGTVLICDRNDYSRVYYLKSYMPTTGHLSYMRECSNFDSQGFPHNATVIEYNIEGKLKKKEIYTIEKVELNPVIPDQVFKFQPPEDYEVDDQRPPDKRPKNVDYLRTEDVEKTLRQVDNAFRERDLTALKEFLKHRSWRVRSTGLGFITGVAEGEELKKIVESVRKDENNEVREKAERILKGLQK